VGIILMMNALRIKNMFLSVDAGPDPIKEM